MMITDNIVSFTANEYAKLTEIYGNDANVVYDGEYIIVNNEHRHTKDEFLQIIMNEPYKNEEPKIEKITINVAPDDEEPKSKKIKTEKKSRHGCIIS